MFGRIKPQDCPAGVRALFRNESWQRLVYEAKVIEWSPTGVWVKLEFASGNSAWQTPPYLAELLMPQEEVKVP
jgi:hypothetical protein